MCIDIDIAKHRMLAGGGGSFVAWQLARLASN